MGVGWGDKSKHLIKDNIRLLMGIKSLLFKLSPSLDTGQNSCVFNFVAIVLSCFSKSRS